MYIVDYSISIRVLVVYLQNFSTEQTRLLEQWGNSVRYWPRSWDDGYLENSPADWWIEFDSQQLLVEWILRYGDDTRIMRTLFD